MSNLALMEAAPYRTNADVEELVRSFESGKLPREEWTHGAHLTVALWYLVNYPTRAASILVRKGIRRYNATKGIKTTRTGGYHETMTVFWICAVVKYLAETGEGASMADLANGLVERLGDRRLPFEYYSRERLMSWEARAGWVEPDLKPLD
jgi:hypothetical protein